MRCPLSAGGVACSLTVQLLLRASADKMGARGVPTVRGTFGTNISSAMRSERLQTATTDSRHSRHRGQLTNSFRSYEKARTIRAFSIGSIVIWYPGQYRDPGSCWCPAQYRDHDMLLSPRPCSRLIRNEFSAAVVPDPLIWNGHDSKLGLSVRWPSCELFREPLR